MVELGFEQVTVTLVADAFGFTAALSEEIINDTLFEHPLAVFVITAL